MTALLLIIVTIVILAIAYVTYGSWLSKQWGLDASVKTPAVVVDDGVDYVAAPAPVLMGHHFSSIAGAGPINGPIQASVFGWLPVALWCIIGGIFFGGLHDFGALFASVRNGGKSVGEIIKSSMGRKSQKLFCIFGIIVLLLVVASFVNVVAGTFYTADAVVGIVSNPTGNQTTAMISVLFIILAIIYGVLTNRMGMQIGPATIIGIIGIIIAVVFGLNFGLALSRTAWIVLIGLYITIASLLPVWVMLQPRDYLSSFLLYAMIAVAFVGIILSAFTGSATFEIPAFTGWSTSVGNLFPALFITVACGACSGFHSLISSGTTSKQLAKETDAKAIGYGSMLIESALAVIALIAVGMVYTKYIGGEFGSPAVAFASGIATMFGVETSSIYSTIYALLTLAVSVFALTSLDSGARLCRFFFAELCLAEGEKSYKDASGIRAIFANPLVATLIVVVPACILGGLSLSQIWALFGTANQLLSGIALMAVAAWLGQIGRNNKMFFIPMIFMLVATLTNLLITVKNKCILISASGAAWGDYFQLCLAVAMFVLAIFLIIEAVGVFSKQKNN